MAAPEGSSGPGVALSKASVGIVTSCIPSMAGSKEQGCTPAASCRMWSEGQAADVGGFGRTCRKEEAVLFFSWAMLKTFLWYWARLSSPPINLRANRTFSQPPGDRAVVAFPDSGEFPSPTLGRGLGPLHFLRGAQLASPPSLSGDLQVKGLVLLRQLTP